MLAFQLSGNGDSNDAVSRVRANGRGYGAVAPIAQRRSEEQRTNLYPEFSPRHRTVRRRIEADARESSQNCINVQAARSEDGQCDRQNDPILGNRSC